MNLELIRNACCCSASADAADALRAANDALSCAALGAVVIEIPGRPKILDLMASRRLTLACAQKTVTAFLLRFNAEPEASTAETRWLVRAAAFAAAGGKLGPSGFRSRPRPQPAWADRRVGHGVEL